MSKQNQAAPAVTVDSLINFAHKKKKFSFSNRKLQSEETDEHNEETEETTKDNDDELTVRQPKGSALLKHESDNGSSTMSSSNEEDKCSTHKNSKKKHKHHKKKTTKNSEEKGGGGDEKKLENLIKMFPDREKDEVRRAWTKSKFNSKKAIDLLLKEKENKNRRLSSSSSSESEKEGSRYLFFLLKILNIFNKEKFMAQIPPPSSRPKKSLRHSFRLPPRKRAANKAL